jgi:hypothetical protein
MVYFLSQALHIFIMAVIILFGIMCVIGGGGRFDHWNKRLKGRARRVMNTPAP